MRLSITYILEASLREPIKNNFFLLKEKSVRINFLREASSIHYRHHRVTPDDK